MMVALLALFVALGGTATAARVLVKSSKQIQRGAVHRNDIAKSAVNSRRVANGSLGLRDLSDDAKGALGGKAGGTAGGTQALEVVRSDGPENVAAGKTETVATLDGIPSGTYAILAKTVLTATSTDQGLLEPGNSTGGHCVLDVAGDTDESRVLLGTPGANTPGEVSTQITRTYADAGTAKLICDVGGTTWRASNTSIIALPVGAVSKRAVTGR